MNDHQEQPKSAPRAGGYLFIPKGLQKQSILIWLRRTHAWTGFYGALFFFCLGLTGFYLDHRAVMRIEGGKLEEVATLHVDVDPGQITNQRELTDWMQKRFDIGVEPSRGRQRRGGPVSFGGRREMRAANMTVTFRGPNAIITGEYELGANSVFVKRSTASPLRMLMDMHKVVGVNKAFILIMDTMAGAMMFMSLSGVLLWTRLHGPRLAAVGILSVVAIMTVVALSGTWVGWAAP